ncbi:MULTISPECIES: hypothetical protein [unclassified Brevibacillus]|uniref:hypothetical protein n=1 Tax=unclassified Brevibacillus TaxID=2684853 RepID=UPI003569AFF1
MNYFIKAGEMRQKLEDGHTITAEDISVMFEVAKKTGRMEDKVLYSKLKQKQSEQASE